jgi:hypothetical protein
MSFDNNRIKLEISSYESWEIKKYIESKQCMSS